MERYNYKFNDQHLVYMQEQIWEAKTDIEIYSDLSVHEFSQIESYLGHPKTVLEVGCGLGRGSIFLNHLLKDDTVEYILADRHGRTENTGKYMPIEDEYYNDLNLTADFCKLNGIKNIRTFDTEEDSWLDLPKADLIFSLCSFGMHVSIDRYMDRLLSVSKTTTTMIFGIRNGSVSDENASRFAEVLNVDGIPMNQFPDEKWLILKNPIQDA